MALGVLAGKTLVGMTVSLSIVSRGDTYPTRIREDGSTYLD